MEEQKTIEKEFSLVGKGLQTGKPVEVFFYPEEKEKGIIFVRKDLKNAPSVSLKELDSDCLSARRRTRISFAGGAYIETVEHLLAALWAAEIDNIRVELNGPELPALDGSALEFLKALKKSGIRKQKAERKTIKIEKPLWIEEKESFLGVFPSDIFKISYVLEYPDYSIKRQVFSRVLEPEVFFEEIAPARTIWFVPRWPCSIKQKAKLVQMMGYGRGASEENVTIIADKGPVNNWRFSDEPVRHKVLDLIGDLYLLGAPLAARVIAIRSGHRENLELVKRIKSADGQRGGRI